MTWYHQVKTLFFYLNQCLSNYLMQCGITGEYQFQFSPWLDLSPNTCTLYEYAKQSFAGKRYSLGSWMHIYMRLHASNIWRKMKWMVFSVCLESHWSTELVQRCRIEVCHLLPLEWRHNGTMASQITSLRIVYSTAYSGADQRKHQSSASLAFVWGIHRSPVNSPHKWPVTRKMFPFDDVIIRSTLFSPPSWSMHRHRTIHFQQTGICHIVKADPEHIYSFAYQSAFLIISGQFPCCCHAFIVTNRQNTLSNTTSPIDIRSWPDGSILHRTIWWQILDTWFQNLSSPMLAMQGNQ